MAHLCPAIASVRNTTDQLRRERALGESLAPIRFEDMERIETARKMRSKMTARRISLPLLTIELDSKGHLRSHNGLSFRPGGEGFVSTAVVTAMSGSPACASLNIAPMADSVDDLKSTAFTAWLCKPCLNLVSAVLDAVTMANPQI